MPESCRKFLNLGFLQNLQCRQSQTRKRRATDGPCQRANQNGFIYREKNPIENYYFLFCTDRYHICQQTTKVKGAQLLGQIAKFTMLFFNTKFTMLKEQPLHVSWLNSRMCGGKNHWSICRLRAQAIRQQLENYSSRMTSDLSNYGSLPLSSSSIF